MSFPPPTVPGADALRHHDGDGETLSLQELVARYERRLIEAALARTRGNRARAAKLLNTTERILGYRVQRYGIDCSLYRD